MEAVHLKQYHVSQTQPIAYKESYIFAIFAPYIEYIRFDDMYVYLNKCCKELCGTNYG